MNQYYTAESVTEGHPDKLCDLIADSVLDACLDHDMFSHVACEVMATKGNIIVAGEITSSYEPHIPSIVRSVLQKVGYDPARYAVQCFIHKQSPDIAAGVDCSLELRRGRTDGNPVLEMGVGDQGIMVGYACNETPQMLPLPVVLARRLTNRLTMVRKSGVVAGLRPDGEAQVTVEYDEDGKTLRLDTIVLSAQHNPEKPMDELFWQLTDSVLEPALLPLLPDKSTKILINPAAGQLLIRCSPCEIAFCIRCHLLHACDGHGFRQRRTAGHSDVFTVFSQCGDLIRTEKLSAEQTLGRGIRNKTLREIIKLIRNSSHSLLCPCYFLLRLLLFLYLRCGCIGHAFDQTVTVQPAGQPAVTSEGRCTVCTCIAA